MRVAVSGSSGFVGRHVCQCLVEIGYTIVPLDILDGKDMCNPAIIEEVPQVDCFIHLANLVYVPASYQNPVRFYSVNYLSTLHALEICRKSGAKFIYISSYIYGAPQFLPVSEEHPMNPFNPYAQTKIICEKLCEGYNRDFNIKTSIVRPFNIYGYGQEGKLLIPEIITQLKDNKKRIQLKAGSPRRDYIHVMDLAKAICACINDRADFSIYNVCSGKSISVKEITDIINSYLREKVVFEFSESDRPNEVDETMGSYSKIERQLGWRPTISFEDGIKEMIKLENL